MLLVFWLCQRRVSWLFLEKMVIISQSVKFEKAIRGETKAKGSRERHFVGDAAVDLSQHHQQAPEKQDLSRGLTSKASGPM